MRVLKTEQRACIKIISVCIPIVAALIAAGVGLNVIKTKAKEFDPSIVPVVEVKTLDIPPEVLGQLRAVSNNHPHKAKHSKLGGKHYSAGVFSSHFITDEAPAAYGYYWNGTMANQVGSVIGMSESELVPINKTTGNILISYSRVGDHIGFHYDSYATGNGRMINVIVHVHATPGSCSTFQYYQPGNNTQSTESLETVRLEEHPPGTAVVFEGTTLYHRVTPQCGPGEERLVWSTMFVVNEWQSTIWSGYLNLMFDFAYRGFRQTVYDRILRRKA